MKNFDTPYFSKNVPEFWRRWHISLSTWFKDYVYIPMGGNRVSKPRWIFNQMVTFTVSGIWHGAAFTFVVWGMLNGVYIVISRFVKPVRDKIKEMIGLAKAKWLGDGIDMLITFCLISVTWVFFRANSFADAFYVFGHLFSETVCEFPHIAEFRSYIALGAPVILLAVDALTKSQKVAAWYTKRTIPMQVIRIASYAVMLFIIVIFGAYDNKSFIYFQF